MRALRFNSASLQLLQDLEEAERQLRGADDGAAEAIMAGETARAMSFHDQEIAALEVCMGPSAGET